MPPTGNGRALGLELCRALGIDAANVVGITVRAYVGEAATVAVTYRTDDDIFSDALAEYELVPRRPEAAA